MLTDDDLVVWIAGLDDLFARVAGRFFRVVPRCRARAYVRGLLAPLAGKNGWALAEAAGEATPGGMQRLLNAAAWDADGVRDDLRAHAVEHLGERDGVSVVDETGFSRRAGNPPACNGSIPALRGGSRTASWECFLHTPQRKAVR